MSFLGRFFLIFLLSSFVLVGCGDEPSEPNPDPVANPEPNPEPITGNIPAELFGKWIYLHDGNEIWLDSTVTLDYQQLNLNHLRVNQTNGALLQLIRVGIPNVQTKGSLASLPAGGLKAKPGKTNRNIAGISVVLQNINDGSTHEVTSDVNGEFTAEIPTGEYTLTAEETNGNIVETPVVIEGESVDLGEFTLVPADDYNFKVTLENDEKVYFGTLGDQDGRVYQKSIKIENIGSKYVTGLTYAINLRDAADPDINSFQQTINPVGGLNPGESVSIPVAMSFKRPALSKDIIIDTVILDAYSRSWNDHSTIKLSEHKPFKVSVLGETQSVTNAYVMLPGRIPVNINLSGSDVELPYLPDQNYEFIVNTNSPTSETKYCINIGLIDGCQRADLFTNFSNTILNEIPTSDNTVDGATALNLYSELVSYSHAGDVDYYVLEMPIGQKIYDFTKYYHQTAQGIRSENIVVSGGYLYEVDRSNGIRIYDITNGLSPVYKKTIPETSHIGKILISNNTLYLTKVYWGNGVVQSTYFLDTYDVSDPMNPIVESSTSIPEHSTKFDIRGNRLYLLRRMSEANDPYFDPESIALEVFDITDLDNIVSLDKEFISTMKTSFVLNQNYIYLTSDDLDGFSGGPHKLHVFNISGVDPLVKVSEQEIHLVGLTSTINGEKLYIGGQGWQYNDLYNVVATNNFLVFDLTDPVNPVFEAEYQIGEIGTAISNFLIDIDSISYSYVKSFDFNSNNFRFPYVYGIGYSKINYNLTYNLLANFENDSLIWSSFIQDNIIYVGDNNGLTVFSF